MTTGCPVLVGNHSAILEVVGTGALTIDPYSLDEIIKGMLAYVNNKALRDDISIKGLA
jgi:glycosyltransferase involved in cell wall biosynthesis